MSIGLASNIFTKAVVDFSSQKLASTTWLHLYYLKVRSGMYQQLLQHTKWHYQIVMTPTFMHGVDGP